MAQRAAVSAITETYTNLPLTAYRPMTAIRKGPSAAPARGASGAFLALGAQMRGPWPEVPESGQPQDVVIGMDRGAWK
jgi:hypothetical protein